jgi:hypothetical protein
MSACIRETGRGFFDGVCERENELHVLSATHHSFVQELLGRATIALTLDRYSHWKPGMGDQIVTAMEAATR